MKKFLGILLLIIIIPVVGLIAFLKFADFNQYKPQIEALALKYANIDLKIGGDLKIGVSLKPSVELNDVKVANAETKAQIAEIGNALVQFSLMPLLKKEVVVDTVQTSNTKIYYGETENVLINDLVVGMDSYSAPINISFDTDISGTGISGEGTVSSFQDIQKSGFNSVSADMKVKALGYTVHYKGDVTGLQSKIVADGSYEILYKTNKIAGKVNANLTGAKPAVKLDASSDNLNVYDFTAAPQADNYGFISTAEASELVPNTPIPYEFLTMADADVALNIKQLNITPEMSLSGILSKITLKDGVLNTVVNNITAGTGTIKGDINVNAGQKSAAVNLTGTDIVLQELNKAFASSGNTELYVKEGGKSSFNINITTSGSDTNQYLANLNGQTIALVDKSVVKIKSLEAFQGNIIAQILDKLKLNITNKDLTMSCAVVRGDIKNGIINFPKGIVFDANDFYLVANGQTNLQNDKMNFDLQPFSGKISNANVSSLIGSLLKIEGTVTQPKLGINQTQTAKTVIGAIATAGAFNAGDLLLSADSSPCHTALKGTSYASYFPGDDTVQGDVNKTYNDAKEVVKDLGNQAKDVLKGFLKDIKK